MTHSSTDKGDLPATAVSKATGPSGASGLPKEGITMTNLLTLLLAKAGTVTVTTKIVVAGVVSVAALGAAGATGVIPVDHLLPSGDTSASVPDQRAHDVTLTDVEDATTAPGELPDTPPAAEETLEPAVAEPSEHADGADEAAEAAEAEDATDEDAADEDVADEADDEEAGHAAHESDESHVGEQRGGHDDEAAASVQDEHEQD